MTASTPSSRGADGNEQISPPHASFEHRGERAGPIGPAAGSLAIAPPRADGMILRNGKEPRHATPSV